MIWWKRWPMQILAFHDRGSEEWSSYIHRFTDIAFAWASVTEDGQLSRSDDEYYRWPGQVWTGKVLQKVREERANPYLAVIQWDGDGRVTRLALSPEARERFAAQLKQEMEAIETLARPDK